MKQDIETLLAGMPIGPLVALLDQHEEWFHEITIRQDFIGSAHHATQCIFLRGPDDFLSFFALPSRDYPRLADCIDALQPILTPLLEATECCDLGRVMIARLPPHKWLDWHRDEGDYAAHYSRFHCVLTDNARCRFEAGDDIMTSDPTRVGNWFWFNHRVPHSASNDGDTDRLHLIVDLVSPHFTVDVIV
jgi:hypothetical protein